MKLNDGNPLLMSEDPVKVLIVDDSIVFRKAVEAALANETDVNICGSVRNGEKALEFIRKTPPDLVTLDLEMPDMDGLSALKEIQQFNESRPAEPPVRVLMLSAFTKAGEDVTVKALEAGAFDFVEKPESASASESVAKLRDSLLEKIRGLPGRKPREELKANHAHVVKPEPKKPVAVVKRSPKGSAEAVVIGVSTGGPKALADMLPELCKQVSLPILIVQHMPPGFTKSLANQLNAKCEATVSEAQDGDLVEDGHVYVAPGGRHMTVRKLGSQVKIALTDAAPENGCRPAVDVLFRSAASVYGSTAVAAILTGMGSDGTKACKNLSQAGARIIVQDEATSVVWGMPGSAVATGLVERVEPLLEIPKAIKSMCGL